MRQENGLAPHCAISPMLIDVGRFASQLVHVASKARVWEAGCAWLGYSYVSYARIHD